MVIATRLLKIRNAASEHPVQIRISAPEQKDAAWSCSYEIDWPEGVEKRAAWGADSAQAILLAFQMIGADLYTSNYHKAGKLVSVQLKRDTDFRFPAACDRISLETTQSFNSLMPIEVRL
jgi:uncharacterized protein DUF6968